MNTTSKQRAARQTKPKEASLQSPVQQVSEAAPIATQVAAPIATQVAAPIATQVAAPIATPEPDVDSIVVDMQQDVIETVSRHTRVQTNKAIGVSISAARVRRHIDKLNINATLDMAIKECRTALAPVKDARLSLDTATDEQSRAAALDLIATLEPDAIVLEQKITALARERTRFSNEAAIVLSIICDELIQQLVEHTISRAIIAKKKIIQVAHLHEPGVEQLTLYPLIRTLQIFAETASNMANAASDEKLADSIAVAVSKAEKEFKRRYNVPKTTIPKPQIIIATPPASPAVHEVFDESDEGSDSKTSFKFYVHQACKEIVKRNPRYNAIRVSTEIRTYLSDILIAFIGRIAPLIKITTSVMNNKTIGRAAILNTVMGLMIDGHVGVETVSLTYGAGSSEYVATRTITFPTTGYAALTATVAQKLELYTAIS